MELCDGGPIRRCYLMILTQWIGGVRRGSARKRSLRRLAAPFIQNVGVTRRPGRRLKAETT